MAPINIKTAANDFLSFVNASPTPFHAVKSVREKLANAGFKEIKVRLRIYRKTVIANGGYVGARIVVFRMPSWWEILPNTKWINNRCICDRQKMASRQSSVDDWSAY